MTDQEFAEEFVRAHSEPNDGIARRTFKADMTLGDGRTVDVRICPYDEVIEHNDGLGGVPKGVAYREQMMPGVFNHQLKAANRVLGNVEHEQGIKGVVARGLALREGSDGFYGSFRMLKGQDADKTLELIEAGVIDGVSYEALFVRSVKSAAGVIQRLKANLDKIAFTRFSAYKGAAILGTREEAPNVIDEYLEPFPEIDPERVARWRAMGIRLPQRLEAHPADEHPDLVSAPSQTTPAGLGTTDFGGVIEGGTNP